MQGKEGVDALAPPDGIFHAMLKLANLLPDDVLLCHCFLPEVFLQALTPKLRLRIESDPAFRPLQFSADLSSKTGAGDFEVLPRKRRRFESCRCRYNISSRLPAAVIWNGQDCDVIAINCHLYIYLCGRNANI